MANGVNIKMGVSGIAQFKQGINQAKQSVKTLDAQLALSEKQFKATGDSESYMTEKAELLKAKLEAQKTVLKDAEQALDSMAKNGVDRSSKAYQDMYRQMLTAKGEILDTENAMKGVEEAASGASNETSEMNQQLKRIGDGVNWQNVTEGLGTITDGMKNVMAKAWQMGEAIVKATLGAGSWADEIQTTAAKYEITPEELQRMRKTANMIDTDAETILDAQDKLKKNREGQGKEFMGALAALGIDPSGKSDLDLFWEAGDALAKLGRDEDKVTYAQRLFGKSWRELLPLFQTGREEYDRTMESWSVVEDEQLDALGKMDDAYQKMQGEWETFKNELLSAFAGPLTEGMDTITGLFQELTNYLDTPEGQAMLKQIGDTISTLISDLTAIKPEEVVAGFQSVVEKVTGALQWISENKDTVVTAVEGFILAWAGLEVAKGVTVALKLVNAVSGLISGGEAAAAGSTLGSSWAGAFASAAMKAAPFLAFLYTLLNPSSTANDDLDLLWDENGNPTQAGRDAGLGSMDQYTSVDDMYPDWMRQEDQAKIQEKFSTVYTGNAEDAEARNARRRANAAIEKMGYAAEELSGESTSRRQSNSELTQAANGMKGLPAEVAGAIYGILNGMSVKIDGQAAGAILAPYINAIQGINVLNNP